VLKYPYADFFPFDPLSQIYIHKSFLWVLGLSSCNMRVTLSDNILGVIVGEQIEDISLGLNDKEILILKVH
jgi:hypothetical protein